MKGEIFRASPEKSSFRRPCTSPFLCFVFGPFCLFLPLVVSSEGGTGEDRRIDPHLNVGILEKIIIIFGNNWFRLKFFSDPHLDKIHSALNGCKPIFGDFKSHCVCASKKFDLSALSTADSNFSFGSYQNSVPARVR